MDQFLLAGKLGYISIPFWACAMACIKSSVCLMLLKFERRRAWRIFLFAMIGVQVCFAIWNTLFILLECRPLTAAWDLTMPRSLCVSDGGIRASSNAAAGVNITTDIILSLIPLSFLSELRRPMAEKVLLFLLMALGLFASAASIAKTAVVRYWGHDADFFSMSVIVTTWACVEQFVAIIAANAPWLKNFFQTLLSRFGIKISSDAPPSNTLPHISASPGDAVAVEEFKSGVPLHDDTPREGSESSETVKSARVCEEELKKHITTS